MFSRMSDKRRVFRGEKPEVDWLPVLAALMTLVCGFVLISVIVALADILGR